MYVADTLNDRVQKFDRNGNFITKWGLERAADVQYALPTYVNLTSKNYHTTFKVNSPMHYAPLKQDTGNQNTKKGVEY